MLRTADAQVELLLRLTRRQTGPRLAQTPDASREKSTDMAVICQRCSSAGWRLASGVS
jgi:hypothetical protein